MASRQKHNAQRKALLPAGPAIRPLQGAMQVHVNGQQFAHSVMNLGGFLKAGPANQVAQRMGPATTRAMRRKAPDPAPVEVPLQEPAVVSAQGPQLHVRVREVERKDGYAIIGVAPIPENERLTMPHSEPTDLTRVDAAVIAKQRAEIEALKASLAERRKAEEEAVEKPAVHSKEPIKSAPVASFLGNSAAMDKRKYKFLSLEANADLGATKAVDKFIVFLTEVLAGQTDETSLKAALRKAKFSLLSAEDVDEFDAEAALTTFLEHLAQGPSK